MAHAAVNWAINDVEYPADVSPAARWLLVMICDRVDKDEWQCWPSHKTLAKDAGMSSRSVLALLSKLESNGLIKRTERLRENGTRTTDMIAIVRGEDFSQRHRNSFTEAPQTLPIEGEKVAALNLGREPSKGTSDPDGSSNARGTRLPDGWNPDPNVATLIGLSHEEAASELDRFRDYWQGKAGKEARKADWTKTWRNWCRTALERRHGRGSPVTRPSGPTDRGAERAQARVDAMVDGARQALDHLARRRDRWRLP